MTTSEPTNDIAIVPPLTIEEMNIVSATEQGLTSEETTLLARIPLLAGHKKKYAYLAYRSCGFTILQSCQLAGATHQLLRYWRNTDKTFKKFEEQELQRLQSTIGNDVIRFEFTRNMRLLLKADMGVIFKALTNLAELSPREFELYKNLRKFYTPSDLLAIEKIINPEKHHDNMPVTINLTWGGRNTEREVILQDGDI